MLDVHAPEHTPHSWRDFLIHIATIVVGLLIAVGLEQSVEWLHHRTEVRETRRALAIERKLNRTIADARTKEFRLLVPILQRDLAIFTYLSKHPGAPPDQWPGKISWTRYSLSFDDSAWQTALKSNVVAYMPHNEVADTTELYSRMNAADEAEGRFIGTVADATMYAIREPDASKLSPVEIDQQIHLLTKALYEAAIYGNVLANFSDHYGEFVSPSHQEITVLRRISNPPEEVEATRQIQVERDRAKAEIQRDNNE
jgi:hypothetical protein